MSVWAVPGSRPSRWSLLVLPLPPEEGTQSSLSPPGLGPVPRAADSATGTDSGAGRGGFLVLHAALAPIYEAL